MAYQEKEETGKTGDEKILDDLRKYVKDCVDDEETERTKMRDDLRFCALDQWPKEIRADREGDAENGPRPCLTIDKINQYIVQVVNDMRQGKPGINVRPQDDKADVETAKIIKGIIRNIEDQSSADIAYATAAESAAKIGLGYFRITTEYVDDESFDQEIRIKPIPHTFGVYLGRHIMPDGSDAERGFIVEAVSLDKFKQDFPDAKCTTQDFDSIDGKIAGFWRTDETITVVEEYCLERVQMELLHLADGTTMSKADYDKWPAEAGPKPEITGRRDSYKKQLKWRKATAIEVLDKRDLPGKFIPIVEVVGRETWVDGKRILWGLVRPAKDSLRMYNYWASTITEKLGLAPKTPFIVAKGQLEGLEQNWKKANKKNFAYLEYKHVADDSGNALPAPQRQSATPMEAAYMNYMQAIEHDVQTSLGMFKAATGESESQQSGRAILALQKESDTGTYHFGANQGNSIRHAGRIILDLIPHYYDTKRVLRIIGDDGEVQTAHIDPQQESPMQKVDMGGGNIKSIYNPTIGQYDISISVGPSYNTKRMEAAATFVEMAKGAADPASAAILRYLVMRNSDSAGSDEAAKLLKTMLPPQALQALDSQQPIPPQVQAMLAQTQQKMQMMGEELQKKTEENTQLKAGAQTQAMKVQADAQGQAMKLKADSMAKRAELMLEKENNDRQFALDQEKLRRETILAKQKSDSEMELKRLCAAGDLEIEKRKREFEEECRVKDEAAKHEEDLAKEKKEGDAQAEKEMPKLMEAVKAMAEGFTKALGDNSKAIELLAKEVGKPKKVSMGGIQRNEGGITGATATIQ